MTKHAQASRGYFSFALHAHLPYVLHHGTWPHGLEWLLEAAAETYLPLLRTIRRLSADGIALHANISLSPVLLEQLAHPDFQDELQRYLQRKIASAAEDAAFFEQAGETHLAGLAHHWRHVFETAQDELALLHGDILAGFRAAEESGAVQLLTSAATHGYAPLLGTDEAVHAQFATAVRSHTRHLGRAPEGVWLPECGYRPAGVWHFPVTPEGMDRPAAAERAGVEAALAASALKFTFVDTHLIEDAERVPEAAAVPIVAGDPKSMYRPYRIGGSNVAVFARDPRTAFQVWSAQFGYPGDFQYLDFHKKRWPGGHRYWRVTGAGLGMEEKQPYHPQTAAERTRAHAEHFVGLIAETLQRQADTGAPKILCAPFDLELFGHWWHEGALFLEQVARVLAAGRHGVEPITCSAYLQQFGTAGSIRMHEGSWGAGGDNSVWNNGETAPLLGRMYAAELAVREASAKAEWTDGALGERLARQMCRELMLMESSDWPTLITTGAARDYAERRFHGHADDFQRLHAAWLHLLERGSLAEEELGFLADVEKQDGIFPGLNPADWRKA